MVYWCAASHIIASSVQIECSYIYLSRSSREERSHLLLLKTTLWVNKMEKRVLFIAVLISAFYSSSEAADSQTSFEDNFSIMWSEDHFKTSEDGQTWYLSLDKETGLIQFDCVEQLCSVLITCFKSRILICLYLLLGCGFQTKQRYRFGWFSMKLKLVGGDSAGVVTAYYVCFPDSCSNIL